MSILPKTRIAKTSRPSSRAVSSRPAARPTTRSATPRIGISSGVKSRMRRPSGSKPTGSRYTRKKIDS